MSLYSLKPAGFFSDPPVVNFQIEFYSDEWIELLQSVDSTADQTRRRRKAIDLIKETKRETGYKMYHGLGDQNGLLLKARSILKQLISESNQTADHVLYGYVNKELAKVYEMICDPKRTYKYLKSAVKSIKKAAEYDQDSKSLVALAFIEQKLANTAREYKPEKQEQALLDGLQKLLEAQKQSDLKEIPSLLAHYYLDLGLYYQNQKGYPKALEYFNCLLSLLNVSDQKSFKLPDRLESSYADLYDPLLDLAEFLIEHDPEKKETVNEILQLYYRRSFHQLGSELNRNLPEFYKDILDLARLYNKNEDLPSALKLLQQSHEIEHKALEGYKAENLILYNGLELGLACFRFGRFCKETGEKELMIREFQRAKKWFEDFEKCCSKKDQRIARLFIAMCDICLIQNYPFEDQIVLDLSNQVIEICRELSEQLDGLSKFWIMIQVDALLALAYTYQSICYFAQNERALGEKLMQERERVLENLAYNKGIVLYDHNKDDLLGDAFYYADYLERDPKLLELCREY